ncbi:MAG TPA: acyl-CoA thioesterase [Desulfomicrobiaceae bacterium]|nr:acyl-CoA thioesterase [Desulfomicrobiaceae bacterium]
MNDSRNGKRPVESATVISYRMFPQDTNAAGNIHGGVVLKYIDTTAAVAAMRHVRGNAVTVSIDKTDFLCPVHVGELVTFKASVNMVGKTSMEIGVRVEAENIFTGEVRHTNSAYLTFVALDNEGRPTPVPELLLENQDEIRREQEARLRRQRRRQEREVEGPARPIHK